MCLLPQKSALQEKTLLRKNGDALMQTAQESGRVTPSLEVLENVEMWHGGHG